nr:hypothetical protein [uncultured Neokomagataea sp.]
MFFRNKKRNSLNEINYNKNTDNFFNDVSKHQNDNRQALLDINERFHSSELLKRSDYYFLILMARRAVLLTRKEQVRHQSIKATLEITLSLWNLIKDNHTDGHHKRYLLSNIGGSWEGEESHSLITYIPLYIEKTKNHPYPNTLDCALRNPEVMLRDNTSHISDIVLHEELRPYFEILHGMAVRCFYLETKNPLSPPGRERHFTMNFSAGFGKENILTTIQNSENNFSCSFSFNRTDESMNFAANTIVEVEEFITAFSKNPEKDKSYEGEHFTLIQTKPDDVFKGGIILRVYTITLNIRRQEYDLACEAIAEMLADPGAQKAIKEAHDYYGTI